VCAWTRRAGSSRRATAEHRFAAEDALHEIRTQRARLRPLEPADLDDIHRVWTDPEVRRYLWDDEVIPRELAASVIEQSQAQFGDEGHGLWLARGHDSEEIIAFCGFWYFHEPPQLELLYGVAAPHWGRGLATELAAAMLRHGFETLGFERIVGSTDTPNTASARVMEKAGMTFDRRETVDGKDTVFYFVLRPSVRPA
jgi:[ribosomal protein S5]-alanine N-acetyltransferase